MVAVAPVDGVLFKILQNVVHPAHIPLVIEAQPTRIGGAGDHRPGSALFGDGNRTGCVFVYSVVELANKVNSLQVFPPAVAIG